MHSFLAIIWLTVSLCLRAQAATVFAHFMVGNTEEYTYADIQEDIRLAQEAHIDGFALNFAYGEASTDHSMDMIFDAAAAVGFKLIFSFDYAGNGPWPKGDVAFFLEMYTTRPAYFRHHGEKPLVSTFEGPNESEDWHDLKKRFNVFFMPSYSSLGAKKAMKKGVADGLFAWAGWPEGPNIMDTDIDASYKAFLKDGSGNDRPYMMPVSPWFFTNMPGYNKNWLWASDSLWYYRWNQVWHEKPEYVQIISWNDYGESHHIGPIREKAMVAFGTGKSPYNYALGRPHDAWRMFLPFVIDIYKGGTPAVSREGLTTWYRLNHGRACSTGGTTGNTASQLQKEGNPADFMEDRVMFTALLTKSNAKVRVKIGNGGWTDGLIDFSTRDGFEVGLYYGSVKMNGQTGPVTVELYRGNDVIARVQGKEISNSCEQGINNYNPWVGGSWSSRGTSGTALSLSQMGCRSGISNVKGDESAQKLCEIACSYDYCPGGPCSCTFMGTPREKPPGKSPAGYPLSTTECKYEGLCGFACAYDVCPSNMCNRNKNNGPCFIPPDPVEVTPTPSAPKPPAATAKGWRDEFIEAEWDNAANCFISDIRSGYDEQQCASHCSLSIAAAKKEGRTTSYGCISFTPPGEKVVWGPWPFGEYNGVFPKSYTPGKCNCDNPLANELADTIVEALPAVAQIGCFILMSTVRLFVEIGLEAVPGVGRGVHAGIKALARAAKTIKHVYNSDQNPVDAFDFWLSPCGGSELVPDDIKNVFDTANGIADGIVGWTAPKNLKRGSGQKGDSGNPDRDRSPGGNGNNRQVTETKIRSSTSVIQTITKTCTASHYSQACYHYYSVEQNYNWIPKQHTCRDKHENGGNRKAPALYDRQHHKNWRLFTSASVWNERSQQSEDLNCQRDEFPAIYWMTKDFEIDLPRRKGQLVRLLPSFENSGAANTMWAQFCKREDGGPGNNEARRRLKNKQIINPKGATVTEQYDYDYTRAVFEISYDWAGATKPSKGNDWMLQDNPCWPKPIVPDDPGFALFTDDAYYTTMPQGAAQYNLRFDYPQPPSGVRLDDAKALRPDVVLTRKRSTSIEGSEELLILGDGDLAIRQTNSSRRLTERELAQNIQVLDCEDRLCTKELAKLKDESVLLVPASPPAPLPVVNAEVMVTATPAPHVVPVEAKKIIESGPPRTMVTMLRYP